MADENNQVNKGAGEGEGESSGSKSNSSKGRFEVKKFNAVVHWSWDVQAENCAICRNKLSERCSDCQLNDEEGDCKVAWGVCNHAFHFHCISRWLKTRNSCPLDNREWELSKYGN